MIEVTIAEAFGGGLLIFAVGVVCGHVRAIMRYTPDLDDIDPDDSYGGTNGDGK